MTTIYHPLGRTGLRVSRLALGTMTFGTEYGWGCDEATSRAMFDRYIDTGGNFIDTADVYTAGTSERWVGQFIRDRQLRDKVVLATKYTHNVTNTARDPNAAGNGRKNLLRAVDASLQRLGTDYIDLYFLHTWDQLTPVEEVVRTMDDLVRQGKIRHYALSDVPAWYAARARTLAECRGLEAPCALQMEYSLVERGIEYEFTSMSQSLDMGILAWSPLASGLLSGKYKSHTEALAQNAGRLQTTAKTATPALSKFTERNWKVVAALASVAQALDRPMAQVAINWVANRPAVSSVLLGATRLSQLDDLLPALDFELPADLEAQLDLAGQLPPVFPYAFIDTMAPRMHGGALIEDKPPRYRQRLTDRHGGWR
jgi:aryl-alcohol dehydrogenase-like predicted oxidoreductase